MHFLQVPPSIINSNEQLHFEEVQGSYGPITVSEKLLQRVWLNQQILKNRLKTSSGSALEVLFPGFWNKQAGPDFKDAEILVANQRIRCDVEIHFYRRNWIDHQHHTDPSYKRVGLHVVLFEDNHEFPRIQTSEGKEFPTLILLPVLERDLEDLVSENALLALEKRNEIDWIEALLFKDPRARIAQLKEKAFLRWAQKLKFAQKRFKEHGWVESCHQYFMEVLGYRQNRAPMSTLALKYPYQMLLRESFTPEDLYQDQKQHWKLQGVRPANRPLIRLQQYLDLLEKSPTWPNDFLILAEDLVRQAESIDYSSDLTTQSFRTLAKLKTLRDEIKDDILAEVLSSTRLDNWVVDAFLPLATALTGKDFFPYFYHWYSADVPDLLKTFLRQIQGGIDCNGLNQGALQFFFERGY